MHGKNGFAEVSKNLVGQIRK